jgi:crotonobetaine/carnitine-CoA ligase
VDPELVLSRLVETRASEDPDRTFLIEAATGLSLSRAEFAAGVRSWAGSFRSLGVSSGETVLVMLETSAAAVCAWLGAARLKAIAVPVNTQYRGDMLRYIVNDADARVMVVSAQFVPVVAEVSASCPALKVLVVVEDGSSDAVSAAGPRSIGSADFLAAAASVGDLPMPAPHDIATVVYTSGTTGASKGVMMPWAQMYATAFWEGPTTELGSDDVIYLPFPFYHVTVSAPIYQMVLVGGAVVIRDRISVTSYWDEIRAYGITYTNLLGVMVSMLMSQESRPEDSDNPLRIAGVVPRTADIAEFETRFGVRTTTIFNMTEASVPFIDHDGQATDPTSCGFQRPGYETRIVDEWDYPVAMGEVGELIVRTDEPWMLYAGYWRKPAATALAWRNGWFHTGDAFRRDAEGQYFFVDRFKDAIRRRGENISSMELEYLVGRHPDVAEVAALGVPSTLGEEDVKVFVVRVADATLSEADLIGELSAHMPAFMVPRYVEFVEELPKTPTYKIRKVELRSQLLTPRTWDGSKGALMADANYKEKA